MINDRLNNDKLTKEEVKISKFVSMVLRHRPEYIGLKLSKDGWANVYELIEKIKSKGKNIDKDILERVVLYNDKKRFSFNENHTLIRANQGHSIDVDLQFEEKEPPEILFHGTSISSIESIKQEGIKKMGRLHVHLSLTEETAACIFEDIISTGRIKLSVLRSKSIRISNIVLGLDAFLIRSSASNI